MIHKFFCRHDQDMKIALVLRKVYVFGGHTTNVTITAANFPENALVYANQSRSADTSNELPWQY